MRAELELGRTLGRLAVIQQVVDRLVYRWNRDGRPGLYVVTREEMEGAEQALQYVNGEPGARLPVV